MIILDGKLKGPDSEQLPEKLDLFHIEQDGVAMT